MNWNKEEFEHWQFAVVPSDVGGWIRFYWKEDDFACDDGSPNGFEFAVFEIMELHSGEPFETDGSKVQLLFHGEAAFDGIRHFWLGSEKSSNEGYWHYADLRVLEFVLNKLKELEEKCCTQSDRCREGKK